MEYASKFPDTPEGLIAKEMALLLINDSIKHPVSGVKMVGAYEELEVFDDDTLNRARLEIVLEMASDGAAARHQAFQQACSNTHDSSPLIGLASYANDENDKQQVMTAAVEVSFCILPPFHIY